MKADIFALALTVVSASGAEPLPTNGDYWHEIRQGKLPAIPQVLSSEFLSLLKVTANKFKSKYLKFCLLSSLDCLRFAPFKEDV